MKNGTLYDILFKYIHIRSMGASSVSTEKIKEGGGGGGGDRQMGQGGEGLHVMLCVFVIGIGPNVHYHS